MNIELILKYVPAIDSAAQLLSAEQKSFLHSNVDYLAPYIHTEAGKEALHLFLHDFAEHVLKHKKV